MASQAQRGRRTHGKQSDVRDLEASKPWSVVTEHSESEHAIRKDQGHNSKQHLEAQAQARGDARNTWALHPAA